MFITYLKKHRKALSIKFVISVVLLVNILFLIIGPIIILVPPLQTTLLSLIGLLSSVGFGFLLLGILLVAGLLCTVLWVRIEDNYMSQSNQEIDISVSHINEMSNLLLEEDNPSYSVNQVNDGTMILLNIEGEQESEEKKDKAIPVDDSIEAFAQQARDAIQTIKDASSELTADKQVILEAQLNEFKKRYYRLSRIYHPDLERDESEKIVKKAKFQELSQLYKQVQDKCDGLKASLEQQLHPAKGLYQDQSELLRKTSDLLQEHNNILQNSNEILSETTGVLQETNEILKAYVAMLAKHNSEVDENMKQLQAEVVIQNQKLEENKQKLKEHKEELDKKLTQMKQEFQEGLQEELRQLENSFNSDEEGDEEIEEDKQINLNEATGKIQSNLESPGQSSPSCFIS